MRYLIRNPEGNQIIQGTYEECEKVRRHYLDVELMKKWRVLSRLFDAKAGAVAFRTALDRRNEAICTERVHALRHDFALIQKRIAYYLGARPVEVGRRAA